LEVSGAATTPEIVVVAANTRGMGSRQANGFLDLSHLITPKVVVGNKNVEAGAADKNSATAGTEGVIPRKAISASSLTNTVAGISPGSTPEPKTGAIVIPASSLHNLAPGLAMRKGPDEVEGAATVSVPNPDGTRTDVRIPVYPVSNSRPTVGVVIVASGTNPSLLRGAYTTVYLLRNFFSSTLPVEIFHIGPTERFSEGAIQLFQRLGNVTMLDILEVSPELCAALKCETDSKMGFHQKPRAVLQSSFDEVLLLDADSVLFQSPAQFFDHAGYSASKMLLFRDYVPCLQTVSRWFLTQIGVPPTQFCSLTAGNELDSSAVVVSKRDAWKSLHVIDYMNINWPDKVFANMGYMLGDKDTWALGSLVAGFMPQIADYPAGLILAKGGRRGGGASGDGGGARIFSGHLQFDDKGSPLYYNGQSLDALLEVVESNGLDLSALAYIDGGEVNNLGGYNKIIQSETGSINARAVRQFNPAMVRVLSAIMELRRDLDFSELVDRQSDVLVDLKHADRLVYADRRQEALLAFDKAIKVRKTPSWPRSWANFSLLQLYSRRDSWANLHRLGQPNTFLAQGAPRFISRASKAV
jgi:hypothetical protein